MAKTTFEFNETADRQLRQLSKKLGVKRVEAVRGALSLYAFVVDELTKPPGGRHLAITKSENGDKVEKIIIVPGVPQPEERPVHQTTGKAAAAGGTSD